MDAGLRDLLPPCPLQVEGLPGHQLTGCILPLFLKSLNRGLSLPSPSRAGAGNCLNVKQEGNG